MGFQRELEETCAYLEGNRLQERRKALDKMIDLLNNEKVIPDLNKGDPFSWQRLLEVSQNCLRKECEKAAELAAKKGEKNICLDKNIERSKDLLVLIVKTAIQEGEEYIKISKFIKYIEGCLKEKKMRVCRNDFLLVLKDCILPNPNSLGCLEEEDFILLFTLLKSELQRSNTSKFNDIVVFNCFMLLVKHGPLAAFPASFLREQFSFISKLCQSVSEKDPRPQQEDVLKIVLDFCKHTAEDNRISCSQFGEEIFPTMLELYLASGHDSVLKINFIEFCLLQITIHNPNGAYEGEPQAFASNWHNWKIYIKKMYSLLTREISEYLTKCVKNTLFFVPDGTSTVILDSLVLLFVEVCKQVFKDTESPMNYSLLDTFDTAQSQKRRKVEATLDSFVAEIQATKSWVWVKLIGALLNKYPNLIDERLFVNLLQILHTLQLEIKDNNTISYTYECQAVLIEVEGQLNISNKADILNIWKLVGDSTLRAVGLNQNIKETQNLLQKLIVRNIINLEAVIQTYTSGVLIITEHHLYTLELVLEHVNFSQLETTKKEEIFNCLLNSQSIRNYTCFLKRNFAEILITLMLKQCPDFTPANKSKPPDPFGTLIEIYAKSNMEVKYLIKDEDAIKKVASTKRTFNIDETMVKILTEKIQLFVQSSQDDSLDRLLCIVGLLYNILSCMITYQIIDKSKIEQCQVYIMIKQILCREQLVVSLKSFENHSEKRLKELLFVISILTDIFSIKNNVTDVVKSLFPLDIFHALCSILNFFQDVAKRRAELEHKAKNGLTEALSRYCLISNSNEITKCQLNILLVLTEPDYDFTDNTDYDLAMTFLRNIKYANSGFLPEEVIERILECLKGLCVVRYRSHVSSMDILRILRDFYVHLKDFENDENKSMAVTLSHPFYSRISCYGPHITLAVLDCIEELCKVDPNCHFSRWQDKEVIKHVPYLLASDYQSVRYRAIEVLVQFIKISSGTTRLENIHRVEELFSSIYDKSIQVFSVEGELTEERRRDEVGFRAASALYTYVSIIVNCNNWLEESLFAILKLEHSKGLYTILNGALMEKAFSVLKLKFGCQDFMDKYLENILSKWLQLRYNINEFQYKFFNCSDKTEFYLKHFDICLPLLLKKDRNDLFTAAKCLKMTEKDVLERCCTKIFGRALFSDVDNIGDDFIHKNVEVSYLFQVLGDRLKEILRENIEQVILSLLGAVTDEKVIQESLGETVVFTTIEISFKQFNICLKYIEKFICNGEALIIFLNQGNVHKIQNILLELEIKTCSGIAEDQVKCFHQYTIFVDHIIDNIGEDSKLSVFIMRDTIYYLIHMTKNNFENKKLCGAILTYMESYLRKALSRNVKQFNDFLIFTVNSIKNVALENDSVLPACIKILTLLIIDNAAALEATIEKLDAFPEKLEFEAIKTMHHNIKYSRKELSLKNEIESFLQYDDMATRQDSLVLLKNILAKEKQQLKCMYDNLDETRGFSEDCEKSILHRLTSTLVKMSCYLNESVSREAIKCLGELGPANLTTLVLEPEKKVLNVKCNSFELLTGHVISLLTQYVVDPDINVVKTASEALYIILKFKEAKKVVDSRLDFGYGVINKDFIIPYINNPQKSTSQVRVNFEMFSVLINDPDLWCPLEALDNNQWITSLVLALLKSFDYVCYLKELVCICKAKAKFCEHILPLLIYLVLSLKNNLVTETLSRQINEFFSRHWNLTVTSSTDKTLIPVNKKSVKCMLDVINFVRQQFSFRNKSTGLKLNYLPISKAAEFCSAHFSALLYAELWCQEKIAYFEQNDPRDGTPFENGYSYLDYIYENVPEETGITLQNVLQSAYKAIGDLDALSGCGISFLLRPDHRVEYYKNVGRWDNVLHYYNMQPIKSSDLNHANLIESFKMNQLYQLPLLCTDLSEEPQYECLWRLGQWNTNRNDNLKSNGANSKIYEKYQFYSLKALCDYDQYTLTESKKHLSMCIINDLKHTSLESSKNLYPILTHLQSLVEIDDWEAALQSKNFEEVLHKWKLQDAIIRKNDFQFVEPVAAQRITILGEYVKKDDNFKNYFFEMVLNFADYAKEEHCIRVAENAVINIRKIPELNCEIKNELQFREAQLAWLNNDKVIAQELLRKLCKNEDITPRLKAKVLKLQGEYMAEVYSDRTNILNSFFGSIRLLNDTLNELTTDDYKNIEDTYDKIATFADREYQQIMNHIKSHLFQTKVSNMKSCKEMIKSISEQRSKSVDEKRAVVIHQRQSKIDENEIKTTMNDKDSVLCLALKYYIKNLSRCDANNIKIFRVISLFLENRDNQKIAEDMTKLLPQVPSYKYITMLPQLIPHISQTPDLFSDHINKIIEKCAVDHPHHTLPLLLALVNANKDREYSQAKTKTPPSDRTITAVSMIEKLGKKNELSQIIPRMQKLSEALIELAYHFDTTTSNRKNQFDIHAGLRIHKIRHFDNILVPTITLPVSKSNEYNNIIGIAKFMPTYKTVGGMNAPKRIECRCTTGQSRPQLVKGQDDLRQDAVMEQVFTIMTDLLSSSKQTKNLIIRTYKIVPLSMRSGILEWVANSMPVGDYLAGSKEEDYIGAHREFRPKDRTPGDCRIKFKSCESSPPEEKLKVFNSICKKIKPVFHKFFEAHFPQPSVWYERKRAYIHSVATTSMCGYILGIGDRHVSNILIDKQTAEVIHIDFGIAFEQGKCLPTPETVPFRLSRDIVDGMGVSGIEGLFRKSCEKTMGVLRANSQTILTILEVLLYDPLYFWTLSTAEANKRQTDDDNYRTIAEDSEEENKNIPAERALLRLRGKLQGTEDGKQSSVEQQVGTLIQQAMDPANLCRLFNGWQPYL